jgi:hypothetical protein
MKTCSKCKVEKDEAEFSKNKSKKDGLDYRCKACWREYRQTDAYKALQKKYQQTDSYKEYQRAYQQTDAFKKNLKAYQQTDAYKKHNREYMQAHRIRKKAAAAGNTGQSRDTKTLP